MIIGFDTETHPIKLGMIAPKLVCMTWDGGIVLAPEAPALFRSWLEAGHTVVGHNAPFDLGVMCAEDPSLIQEVFEAYEEGRIKCTEVRERLINNATGELTYTKGKRVSYSLASLVMRHFQEVLPKEDTWRLKYALLDGVPLDAWPEDAKSYALRDAVEALRVFHAQETIAGGPIPDERRQQCAAWWLHLCSMWGLRTDAGKVRELKARLEADVAHTRPLLTASGLVRVDGSKDTKKIKERVLAALPDVERTKTGQVSMKAAVLRKTEDPDLVLLANAGRSNKLLSTYMPVLERGTVYPICCHYTSMVESGRTSCSKPNVQNLPTFPGVRECYVPRDGYHFLDGDWDTLELRALAQVNLELFGHSRMAEEIKAGRDLHLAVAATLMRLPVEEATALYRAGDADASKARKLAKVMSFGFAGGLGAKKFVEYAAGWGIKITLDEAKRYKALWLETFPEMVRYFDLISKMTRHGEASVGPPLTTIFRGGVRFSKLANMLFQSRAAAGAKDAGWMITRACHTPGDALWGSRIVAFVHDEFLLEAPKALAAGAAERLRELMARGMAGVIPDIPATATPVLMSEWNKEAKPVFDEDGNLMLWEDED